MVVCKYFSIINKLYLYIQIIQIFKNRDYVLYIYEGYLYFLPCILPDYKNVYSFRSKLLCPEKQYNYTFVVEMPICHRMDK